MAVMRSPLPYVLILTMPTNSEIAVQTLADEAQYRFPSFTATDAVTLGLSIRKRFRGSSRHVRFGRGLLISIQTIAGHTLFACTVGDLATEDVSLDKWDCLDSMIKIVRSTGHSSYYAEKSNSLSFIQGSKFSSEFGAIPYVKGGAFPIWLQNASCCPIAVVAAYGGSSLEDHTLVANTIRDYLAKTLAKMDPISQTVERVELTREEPEMHDGMSRV